MQKIMHKIFMKSNIDSICVYTAHKEEGGCCYVIFLSIIFVIVRSQFLFHGIREKLMQKRLIKRHCVHFAFVKIALLVGTVMFYVIFLRGISHNIKSESLPIAYA